MPQSRRIELSEEEDVRLREIEQSPHFKAKVRLRAQVLRLSNRGSNMSAISAYTGRGRASIARDLDRWQERGLEGLADGTAPGNPPRITEEAKAFLHQRLSEERTWNAAQLAEALLGRFGVGVTPEAVRQHLLAMGCGRKRTRYVPNKAPDAEEERKAKGKAKEELEGLKKGRRKEISS
jgi:transposase